MSRRMGEVGTGPGSRLALLVVLAVSAAAAVPVRFAADAAVFGFSGGGCTHNRYGRLHLYPYLDAPLMRATAGVEVNEQIGVVAGAELMDVSAYDISLLPVTARLWWDLDGGQGRKRRTAYVQATFHYSSLTGDLFNNPPFLELGAGFAYTYYIVTPVAEFRVRPSGGAGWRTALMVGFELGGAYVFGSREAEK